MKQKYQLQFDRSSSPTAAQSTVSKPKLIRSLMLFSAFMFWLLSLSANAQESRNHLTLEEAIETALKNNPTVTLAVFDEKIAAANYKQTIAFFLPQVNLSYAAMLTNNPLNAFGFKLQQQNISQNDFNPVLLNNPSATADYMAKATIQQPLLNIDQLYQRKSAQQQTSLYQFKTQRTKEFVTFQVKQSYMQLQLAYEGKKVIDEGLKSINAIYKFTNDRFAQGLIQKSDVLNVNVQVKATENNNAEAISNIKNASDQLSLLMNVSTSLPYKTDEFPIATQNVNVIESLSNTRADFKAMEMAVKSYDLMIKSSKMSYIPRLNSFANYQLNDNKLFGTQANSYLAGIQLSWDVFKGNQTKNKIAIQTLERNKLSTELAQQKQASLTDIEKTKRGLADAEFKVAQQKLALESADEALRILENRYNQGLVNTTDVLSAQTQLLQQKLSYQQAVYSNNLTAAYLQFLTAK
jgi:outer membrane protein TolC